MSINHFKNLLYILHKEGIGPAWSYDLNETKRRHSPKFPDIKDCSGLNTATEYIEYSNRPDKYKRFAITLIRELTHNDQWYFQENLGINNLIDDALCGTFRRNPNCAHPDFPDFL